jgi:hypothetical protein
MQIIVFAGIKNNAPGRTRTCDPRLRRPPEAFDSSIYGRFEAAKGLYLRAFWLGRLPGTVARGDVCPTVARCLRAPVWSRLDAQDGRAAPHLPPLHPPARDGPHWYGKWYRGGRPVIRALGRAWVEPGGDGGWRRRRGRAPEGTLTESEASVRMLELVRSHHAEQVELESDERERRRRGVTFRELATDWLAGWSTSSMRREPSRPLGVTTAGCSPSPASLTAAATHMRPVC